jgi:hypothetical protein
LQGARGRKADGSPVVINYDYTTARKKPKQAPLDHNHTHFILVDDGTVGKPGGEIEFRSRLEKFISEQPIEKPRSDKGDNTSSGGSFIYSFNHSLIHSFYSFIDSLIDSFIHSCIHSFIHFTSV